MRQTDTQRKGLLAGSKVKTKGRNGTYRQAV